MPCTAPAERLSARAFDKRRRPLPGTSITTRSPAFERTSKRRKGFPSETNVKRGQIELLEKLGRGDPCACGSGGRFQEVLPAIRLVSTARSGGTIGAEWTELEQSNSIRCSPNFPSSETFVAMRPFGNRFLSATRQKIPALSRRILLEIGAFPIISTGCGNFSV